MNHDERQSLWQPNERAKRAGVVSVRKLLSGTTRIRPAAHRRGFVWELPKVAQLLVDLELAAREDDDPEYEPERLYLGILSFSRAANGALILHDGLQRLTVIAMFLAFARDRVASRRVRLDLDRVLVRRSMGRPPEPRLRLAPEDHAWFAHFILPPGATLRLPATTPLGSPKHLMMAARFMEKAFHGHSPETIGRLSRFAINHAAFVRSVGDRAPSNAGYGYREPSHLHIAAE
jgi:hypothetical protein